jgi:hypothetical protein
MVLATILARLQDGYTMESALDNDSICPTLLVDIRVLQLYGYHKPRGWPSEWTSFGNIVR